MGFAPPSNISNNDFSQGTDGWFLEKKTAASIVKHVEEVGPAAPGSTRRYHRQLQDTIVNQDFVLSTNSIEGPTYTLRTFETIKGTTGVRIRYRFETSEYPRFHLTQYNDFFKISIRSKTAGGTETEVLAMNSLRPSDFGPGSVYPSTAWRERILPVSADGDTIQVEVTVANVGDGRLQSYVYIDFVDELTQGLCIYSNADPNGSLTGSLGHAAIVFYSQVETEMKYTTYGLWPDTIAPNNGDATDIRTAYIFDDVSRYKYFYCEPISDAQKTVLDGLVAADVEWTCSNSCASFSSETFYIVTKTDVDADDFLGIETPREISESIVALNGGTAIPKEGLPWQGKRRLVSRRLDDTSSFPNNFLSQCNYI